MTVGLLGGSFDPPHNGHVVLAERALDHFGLERLVIVVTGQPPHKAVETDAETRFRLAEAAFAGEERVELSRRELDRSGPSYTVETAQWASAQWGPETVFLVGADEFVDFPAWKDPDGVLEHMRLGVASRPGFPRERLEAVLARLGRPERVELFTVPDVPVSSRDLRARVARGESIAEFVPPGVARLVEELGLYRCYASTAQNKEITTS